MNYIEDKIFEKVNFREQPLKIGEYDYCVFRQCDFSETDFSELRFSDCDFLDCNLSLIKLMKTGFRDISFKNCKMLGLHFDNCLEFGISFSFENCQLNHSSFYKTKITKTVFNSSQLVETDFTECDLSSAVFDNCDLTGAVFDNSILEKTDFRTARNFSIDPENNRIKKAKFSISTIPGLLDKYDIEIE